MFSCRHPQDDSWDNVVEEEEEVAAELRGEKQQRPTCAAFYIAASCGDHRWRTSQR